MAMLLCRTVWLRHYDGRADDQYYGRHRYVTAGNIPHEAKNFVPTADGRLLGFVEVRNWGNINIDRLGASSNDTEVSGVTVVWCAQHPSGYGLIVTGWYLNATVYREKQPEPSGWGLDDGEWPFRILGRVSDSQLVDAGLRDFVIQPPGLPRNRLVFGQADIAYVEQRHPNLAAKLRAYVSGHGQVAEAAANAVRGDGWLGGGAVDPEQNVRVEQAAVDYVTAHYESQGWTVEDVSDRDLGWDLKCTRRGQLFCVEVKGRSPACPAPVALTRKERMQFERAVNDAGWASQYRLAIVHEAVVLPTLRLYRHTSPQGWHCELTSEGITTQPLGLLIQPNS
ncbi:MAG: DUF3883 domain-containing protein [Proteobacteria bacterium]|nr:DUF3883 domain-containing protein [Pseudomonadota bacterium]